MRRIRSGGDGHAPGFTYTKALVAFARRGAGIRARALLDEARELNLHIRAQAAALTAAALSLGGSRSPDDAASSNLQNTWPWVSELKAAYERLEALPAALG